MLLVRVYDVGTREIVVIYAKVATNMSLAQVKPEVAMVWVLWLLDLIVLH